MTPIDWRYSPDLVEGALDSLLCERPGNEGDDLLWNAMRYAACGGGKRLRAQLVLETASLVGGGGWNVEAALPLACAIELIHAYSLVHDDLPAMDNADTRRGRPSCHRKFGDAMAILAGDGLLTMAFELLADRSVVPAESQLQLLRLVAHGAGIRGMVGGQAIDITWSSATGHRVEGAALSRMHLMKTGALIRVACEAGAVAGGGGQRQVQALAEFGGHLGRAFQIHDDVLDITGNPELTGKAASDVANAKHTAPAVFGLEEARALAEAACASALHALHEFGPEAGALRQAARYAVEREK